MLSAQNTILVNAQPNQVWSTLADLERWPDWNTWFTQMRIHAGPDASKEPRVGTSLTFTNRVSGEKTGTYDARITQWTQGEGFTWVSGPSRWLEWAIYGEHWFRVEGETDNDGTLKTRVVQGENIGGVLGFILPDSMLQTLIEAFASFNTELKNKVEGR